jgi:hypothetical protein
MSLQAEQMDGLLHQMNPWWDRGSVPGSMLGVPRPIPVGHVEEALRRGRVALVTGPRRSGKTTILYQHVQGLIDSGESPDRVLYVMLDHPLLAGADAIGEAIEHFMAEFRHPRGRPLHILLDEAHRSARWGIWAKTVHDVYRFPLVLSGSSAMELEAGAMSELTGRHAPVRVRPLGLREYMDFRGLAPSRGDEHVMPRIADDYLRTGGFPEAVLDPEEASRRSRLLRLFDDILLGDIVGSYPIRDVATLRDVAALVLSSTGTPVSFNKISSATGCSVDTAKEYVGHMVACHLVSEVPFHSSSARERARNPAKYYPVDTGMLDTITGGAARGILAETAVFNALAADAGGRSAPVAYWRERREVDFVLCGRPLRAIEVKYRDAVDEGDLGGVRALLGRGTRANVTVVTRSVSGPVEVGGAEVAMVPLWRLLLGRGAPVRGRRPGPRRGGGGGRASRAGVPAAST